MGEVTVYEKPTCSTCQRVIGLLTERGIAFRKVDYAREMLSVEELAGVLAKAGLRPRDVVRMKEAGAGELALDDDGRCYGRSSPGRRCSSGRSSRAATGRSWPGRPNGF